MLRRRIGMGMASVGVVVTTMGLWANGPVMAAPYGGVEFPGGAASFADAVTTYAPNIVAGEPTDPNRISSRALGVPDCSSDSDPDCFVSLGDGGSITVEFTDNSLSGSGNTNQDLYIFEIGPQVEAMFISVSADGQSFTPVGRVAGQPIGVDIDAFGFGPTARLRFVRILDDTDDGGQNGASVGADIDAVGAISSAPPAATTTTSTTVGSTTTTSATTTTVAATQTTAVVTTSTTAPGSVLAATGPFTRELVLVGLALLFAGLVLTAGRTLAEQNDDWTSRL